MWQKLNPIGVDILENTRNHLHKALQLVSATARSYLPHNPNDSAAMLTWDPDPGVFHSKAFGPEHSVRASLDIRRFILSLWDKEGHKEHLVLSGMTYPLAFGWLQIKLDKFGLDSEQFDDRTPYDLIDYGFSHARELSINERAAEEYHRYYCNAFGLLDELGPEFGSTDDAVCRPKDMDASLKVRSPGHHWYRIGFSPGDHHYLEPYYYVRLERKNGHKSNSHDVPDAIWHNKDWTGLVLLISKVVQPDPDHERSTARSFIVESIRQLDDI